jgi:hypothetical protein
VGGVHEGERRIGGGTNRENSLPYSIREFMRDEIRHKLTSVVTLTKIRNPPFLQCVITVAF